MGRKIRRFFFSNCYKSRFKSLPTDEPHSLLGSCTQYPLYSLPAFFRSPAQSSTCCRFCLRGSGAVWVAVVPLLRSVKLPEIVRAVSASGEYKLYV
ncbi:unnamed protein product [Victoria cruziana]